METRNTQTVERVAPLGEYADGPGTNEQIERRLNILLAANAETARESKLYRSDQERIEAESMSSPIDTEKAYGYLGLLLGILPPAAMFTKYALTAEIYKGRQFWIVGVLLVMNLLTAVVGFVSGKLIGRMARHTESRTWSFQLLVMPLIGLLWGIMAGGAGGMIVFVIGAIFGAILGGMVGALAVPAFGFGHRILKRGDMIEMKHFLPLAFGITLTICSFIMGI